MFDVKCGKWHILVFMKRIKDQFKIRSVYQGLNVGKLPSPKLAKLLPEILK